jgi:hypothetical protein
MQTNLKTWDVQQPFFDFDFDSDRPAHSIIKMSCTGWWPGEFQPN